MGPLLLHGHVPMPVLLVDTVDACQLQQRPLHPQPGECRLDALLDPVPNGMKIPHEGRVAQLLATAICISDTVYVYWSYSVEA
jgi:hypothetical protein